MTRIVIALHIISMGVLLLLHHHLNYLLFIERLLPSFSFLLEVFKWIANRHFIMHHEHHLLTLIIVKLLLVFHPISVVVLGISPVASIRTILTCVLLLLSVQSLCLELLLEEITSFRSLYFLFHIYFQIINC